MNSRPTRADVARLAGVSGTTVSHVLNDRLEIGISADTRERVRRVARELGYIPNLAAKALASQRSNLIAIFMSNIDQAYYSSMLMLLPRLLAESGYQAFIVDTMCQDQRQQILSIGQWPIDAIIAVGSGPYLKQYLETTGRLTLPSISIGFRDGIDVDRVCLDFSSGAKSALGHLLEQGCRRIAYAVAADGAFVGEERYDVYLSVMEEAGIEPSIIRCSSVYKLGAYEAMRDWIRSNDLPDGIFCYNDEIAIGIHRALREAGARMPDDVALIGHDGIVDTDFTAPSLSTVSYPTQEMCRLGWQFLQNRIKDPSLPRQEADLPCTLIVRETSKRR